MKATPKTSVAAHVSMPVAAIEAFVNKHAAPPATPAIVRKTATAAPYAQLECCFTYLPVNGSVDILYCDLEHGISKLVSVPLTTQYFFTCVREADEKYHLAWNMSLS